MSKQFAESFFPSTLALLHHYVPSVIDWALPPNLDVTCPEVVLTLPAQDSKVPLSIRHPTLAAGALVGLLVGVVGWRRYRRDQASWANAFIYFGAMNTVALPLHCVLPRALHVSKPHQYPMLWMLDCLFTGLSSICLVLGGLQMAWNMCAPPKQRRNQSVARILQLLELACYGLILIMLGCAHVVGHPMIDFRTGLPEENDNSDDFWWKEPLFVEWVYLGPVLMALWICPPVVLSTLYQAFSRRTANRYALIASITIMAFGVGCAVLGLVGTTLLCRWWPLDVGYLPALVFGGCAISFAGMYFWLSQLHGVLPRMSSHYGKQQ